ncbi:MAG TPA: glycosyltransferase family 4 protein [Gaiellaceae bacterium]|nr:glycosyltransferase family 4 protein [Gaiellaceae bacterium]
MRIALFPSAYAPWVGGVEELTRCLAIELVGSGDEIEVWTLRHPHTLPAQEEIGGLRVRRFELPLPGANLRSLLAFPRAARAGMRELRRAADEFRPDVVHVQCFSANGVYAAALRGTPLVVSLQGETVMDDRDIYDSSLALRLGLRLGLRRARSVTACSSFVLADAYRRFGLPEGRGTVVPNGVDLAGERALAPLSVPFDRFVLGLGRVVRKKGFDLLLEAFARLAPQRPGLGLVVGGDGPEREALAARVHELGLDGRVLLPGSLSRAQVAWAMANASVFVLPSRVEPFGIVVLEALRAGRPVVVSTHGGATEIVRDEREGLAADPFDPDALATAIARTLDEDALRERLTSAGEVRVRAFDWPRVADRYRAIYRSVT